jgi:DNA-directed RNA polymerase specialized sigma24 family protein
VLDRAFYKEMLAAARRHSRVASEAEDLLHETLLAAIAAGRVPDCSSKAWLRGAMRNIAAMQARSAGRRRRREAVAAQLDDGDPVQPQLAERPRLPPLPPASRIVALLALSGHNRAEIRSLLRISDATLRQRIAETKRRWGKAGHGGLVDALPPGNTALAFGSIRRALLPVVRSGRAAFGSHDPDGHPFAVRISGTPPHKTQAAGNRDAQDESGRVPCSHARESAISAST